MKQVCRYPEPKRKLKFWRFQLISEIAFECIDLSSKKKRIILSVYFTVESVSLICFLVKDTKIHEFQKKKITAPG